MKQAEAVLVTVFYEQARMYIQDFLDSLNKQTCKNFDVLIANDRLNNAEEFSFPAKLNFEFIKTNSSISENRRCLIKQAIKRGYKYIIFSDCDDTFSVERVEVLSQLLKHNEIVVNDLNLIDDELNTIEDGYFSHRFKNSDLIDEKVIQSGNILGMSNTAVCSEILNDAPGLITGDSIAFDWYFWASLMFDNYKAYFTNDTRTNYRIHDENTAGLPQTLNAENVIKGISVKCQHYELMSEFGPVYANYFTEFLKLKKRVIDNNNLNIYLNNLNDNKIDHPMWWENILVPSEAGAYENSVN